MSPDDLRTSLAAKSAPFAIPDGPTVELRRLKYGERTAIMAWHAAHKDEPDANFVLQRKVAAVALGLTEADIDDLDPAFIDAIAKEAAIRNGFLSREEVEGKAPPPTTPNGSSSPNSPSHSEPAGSTA